ncbi:DUF502 domain-containing protein [candidate division WOR-3 bacterium]|nr:DUF502 domain-containing protein [candidate division WOR-3 bacterium]
MKRKFITGVVALLPIGLTVFVVWFSVIRIGGLLEVVFKRIPELSSLPSPVISLIGFSTLVLIVYIIGVITSSYVGKRVLKFGEDLIAKVPLIRTLYISVRKFTNAIFIDKSAFEKAVVIEYPRKGIYTMGFMTNESDWEIDGKKGNVNVFIPTSPNPTSGYYIIIPRSEIRETELSIDAALRTIISGGVILPKKRKLTKLKEEVDSEGRKKQDSQN